MCVIYTQAQSVCLKELSSTIMETILNGLFFYEIINKYFSRRCYVR